MEGGQRRRERGERECSKPHRLPPDASDSDLNCKYVHATTTTTATITTTTATATESTPNAMMDSDFNLTANKAISAMSVELKDAHKTLI